MIGLSQLWSISLYQRSILICLCICNLAGTIYGYIWYGDQLTATQPYFLIFVPDSPTASLFLTLSIVLLIFNRQSSILEALAFVTLVKYGTWAVIMNIILFIVQQDVTLNGLMLLFSHGIMALEAFYFYPRFKITNLGLAVAAIWVLLNDYIDYIHLQFPYYEFIANHVVAIGIVTLGLSLIALYLYRALKPLLQSK